MFFKNQTKMLWDVIEKSLESEIFAVYKTGGCMTVRTEVKNDIGLYKWADLETLLSSVNLAFQDEIKNQADCRHKNSFFFGNLRAFGRHLKAFMRAVKNKDIRKLEALSVGWVNVDDKKNGHPLLCSAIRYDHGRLAEWLIKNGADVNVKDKNLLTPLHYTISQRNDDITKLLLKYGADANAYDGHYETPLYRAVLLGNVLGVKRLINAGADVNKVNMDGYAPLHMAVKGNIEIMKMLLEAGADVNLPTKTGITPLLATLGDPDGVKRMSLLIRYGANINQADENGITPLIHAVKSRSYCFYLQDLLRCGADVNQADDEENTPLHYAVRSENLSSIKILLEHGANPLHQNDDGDTPVDLVKFLDCDTYEKKKIIKLLNKYVAKWTSIAVVDRPYYGEVCRNASRVAHNSKGRLPYESQRHLTYSRGY